MIITYKDGKFEKKPSLTTPAKPVWYWHFPICPNCDRDLCEAYAFGETKCKCGQHIDWDEILEQDA